jgi:hypothetical protein
MITFRTAAFPYGMGSTGQAHFAPLSRFRYCLGEAFSKACLVPFVGNGRELPRGDDRFRLASCSDFQDGMYNLKDMKAKVTAGTVRCSIESSPSGSRFMT